MKDHALIWPNARALLMEKGEKVELIHLPESGRTVVVIRDSIAEVAVSSPPGEPYQMCGFESWNPNKIGTAGRRRLVEIVCDHMNKETE